MTCKPIYRGVTENGSQGLLGAYIHKKEDDSMSREYPLYDSVSGRFFRWETMGTQKIKAYEPDNCFVGKAQPEKQVVKKQRELCPFRGHHGRCGASCVLSDGDGCRLVALAPASSDTKGKRCLIGSAVCWSGCALYDGGCVLVSLFERGNK